jgi:hypothetical protein
MPKSRTLRTVSRHLPQDHPRLTTFCCHGLADAMLTFFLMRSRAFGD